MGFHENIFNLSAPDEYDCFVERYHSSFHVLRIRAEQHTPPREGVPRVLEYVFTDVLHFAGNFNWTGANICQGDAAETFRLMADYRLLTPQDPQEEIDDTLDSYALFLIPTIDGPAVRFVAHRRDYALNIMG